MPKDMDEQLNLAHKVVNVVNQANGKICVTLLPYKVGKPESSYDKIRLFARKKEDEKFQQVVYVNFINDEFIHLLDVMNSVYDTVITCQPICHVLKKVFPSVYSLLLFCPFVSG